MPDRDAEKLERRRPRWSELRSMVAMRRDSGTREERLARRAQSLAELRAIAERRVPRSVFDYVDGGAEGEISLAAARAAYDDVRFAPRVLRDVGAVSTETDLLGSRLSMPIVLAPTGFTRLVHHDGERAVAIAAGTAGVPYALSIMGTCSLEEVQRVAPDTQRWFQLYVWRDRNACERLMQRAVDAGCPVLVVTVDVPIGGARLRDLRNGFTMPPSLSPSVALDMARHPRWVANLLTTEPLAFASMDVDLGGGVGVAEVMARMFDPTVCFEDLEWIRRRWPHQLVVKGVNQAQDARRIVDVGADGVVVSNHGGRQLDRTATPLLALPSVVDAVGGEAAVLVDGGVRSGADVVAARALGADAVMVGRAYLYGLMAAGRPGVARALELLSADMHRTLRLLGVTDIEQVDRSVLFEDPPKSARDLAHAEQRRA